MHYLIYTAVAISLWSSLAALVVNLSHIPPFLLLAISLLIGGSLSVVKAKQWSKDRKVIAIGVSGIFGYHFFLFLALRMAPPLSANLLNYLWPIFILLFTPLFLSDFHFQKRHLVGGSIAFFGAVLAIYQPELRFSFEHIIGYVLAFAAAVTWAIYSLKIKSFTDASSATVGLFCLISGGLAFAVHLAIEQIPEINVQDLTYLILLGIGPMGLAFYSWDKALKLGDPRVIAVCSYATPLLSTIFLALFTGNQLSPFIVYAMVFIPLGALIASYQKVKIKKK